ncbi:H-NS histone family protein [Trinickia terrae]|uniref:H-NS histone family protein n=1 Tax=Trinickia terrae TaxID=2571161 RepID=A0A4U1IFF7_9BURK|nr:H-NS histone family protein [Trinickia terrae]TKC92459.1 H-NS histone family protein [Trinickia terrae]
MATLKQIQSRIEKLQAQAESLLAKRASVVIAEIRAMMDKHGLTTADIDAHTPKKRGPKPKGAASLAGAPGKVKGLTAAGKMPPKYRDPATGATWSGHARPPAWIKDAKDRSVFLIDKSAAGASEAKPAAAKKAPAAQKARGVKRAVTRKAAAKKTATAKPAKTSKAAKPAATRSKRRTTAAKSAAKSAAA